MDDAYSEAYVKQLRAESAKNRNRIEELEEDKQAREDADKSEIHIHHHLINGVLPSFSACSSIASWV